MFFFVFSFSPKRSASTFAGQKRQTTRGVFRYLDTSHDGDISSKEFETLERVWRELQQSMYEFLGFLLRIVKSKMSKGASHFPYEMTSK